MSTKTLRKRIALVAVSALGAGLLSLVAVPAANAAVAAASTLQLATTNSTSGSVVATASGGSASLDKSLGFVAVTTATGTNQVSSGTGQYVKAGAVGRGTMLSTGTLVFSTTNTAATAKLTVVVSGGTISGATTSSTALSYSGDLTSVYNSGTAESVGVTVAPNGIGTMSVSAYEGSNLAAASPTNGTLLGTWVITVVASGSSNVVNAAASTFIVDTSSSFANTVDQAAGFSIANGGTGYITTVPADVYGVTLTGSGHAFTASATNGALVGFSAYPTAGTAVTTTVPSGLYVVQGTANTAVTTTVSLVVDGVTIGSKTLTFLGDLAKIDLAVVYTGKVSGTNTAAMAYKAYDAAGNRVALAAPAVKGTDAVVTTAAIGTAETTTTTGLLTPTCATYGTNSGIYLSATNSAGATIASNKVSFSCAGDMYTYTAKLDKSSYKQGEIATLTITGLDVKGKPSNDVTAIGTNTYKPAISGSQMTAVNAPVYSDLTTNGVITYQFVVGNTAGTYSMAVDLPLLTNPAANATDTAKTVSYTIQGDGSVSNAEVLAAIVKLIASINKQIAALQKSLKKK